MYVVESSRSTEEPIMLLDNVIGFDPEDSGSCINGALFQRELLELDNSGYKCIKIYINSPGGNVVDGYNICNAILNSKTPVDTYNMGMAASMAGIIWMTGRKRVMMDYATLMIHNPSGGDDQKMIKALRQSTITILSAKCKMSDEEISYVMDRETWFTSSECLAKGFCTDIQATNQSNQKRMPLASVRAMWKEAKLIQNNFNIDHMAENTPVAGKAIGLSLVAAYLDLSVDASETSVLNAVKTKVNTEILARTKAEDEVSSAKKALDKMKADLDEMTNNYNAMVAANAAAEKKKKEDDATAAAAVAAAELDSKKVTARATITAYATAGRIKNEEVDGWVDDAIILGLDKVKSRIEALPINKTAVSTAAAAGAAGVSGAAVVVDPNIVPANAMSYQAKVMVNVRNRTKTA